MTADITKADVLAVAAELITLDDDFFADVLAYVNEVDFSRIDTDQTVRMARIFLAAHIGARALRSGNGTAGPVTSEQAGGVRRSYGMLTTSGGGLTDLASTPYGQTLTNILNASAAHGVVLL